MEVKEVIFDAIYQVIGVTAEQMKKRNRKTTLVNARIIYVYHAAQFFDYKEICEDLGIKNINSIYHYINLYNQKYKHFGLFKVASDRIEQIIKNN